MVHLQDIRYAFRLLGRSPGFTLLTVLVLAGGLGVSIFTFSFLHAAMIRPLPLDEGERIVRLTPVAEGRRGPVDVVDLAALRASLGSVRDLGAYTRSEVMLGGRGEGRVLTATVADPVLFRVARAPALLGRPLLPADAEDGAEPVIVLSHGTWQAAFGADPAVLGTRVTINGVPTRVVGVMPEGFDFPVTQEAWLPLPAATGRTTKPGTESVLVFGRLAPGVTHEQAAAGASTLLQGALVARGTPAGEASRSAVLVESFPAAQIGDERMLVFTSAHLVAALILLLALVNVTNLLTARANERVRETAVRLALGASPLRLVVQGMWEGVILCLAGGVVGTAGAAWALQQITDWTRANMQGSMAFWWVWQMDRVTLLSAGAFVTVSIVVLGCVVSLHAFRANVREILQDGGARAGSRHEGRVARGLVVMQVTTLTVLMFVGALSGAMAYRAVNVDPGYDPTNLLQASLAPSDERFPTPEARAALFQGVQARLAAHEALDGALLRSSLAEKNDADGRFARRVAGAAGALPSANAVATLGDLSTLGIRLVEGRLLRASDDPTRAPVVLISRSLAEQHWSGESPIGDQVRLAGVGDTMQWRTVVGVVSDLPYGGLLSRDRSPDAIYVPLLQAGVSDASVVVRHRGSEVAGRQALHQVFGEADPLLVPRYVYRASEVIQKSGIVAVGVTKMFGGCFVFALLLAVVGTYGLMSRSIGLRTREIGVRRAFGASDGLLTRMLLGQGARQLGVGTLAAVPILAVVGAAATHFFPLGGAATAGLAVLVSATVLTVVLAATWLPTRGVLRVALRDALWRE